MPSFHRRKSIAFHSSGCNSTRTSAIYQLVAMVMLFLPPCHGTLPPSSDSSSTNQPWCPAIPACWTGRKLFTFFYQAKGGMSKVTGARQGAAKPEEPAVRWVQADEEQQHPCIAHRLWETDLRSPVAQFSLGVILLELSLIATPINLAPSGETWPLEMICTYIHTHLNTVLTTEWRGILELLQFPSLDQCSVGFPLLEK